MKTYLTIAIAACAMLALSSKRGNLRYADPLQPTGTNLVVDTPWVDSLYLLLKDVYKVERASYFANPQEPIDPTDRPWAPPSEIDTITYRFDLQFGSMVGGVFSKFLVDRVEIPLSEAIACADSILAVPPDVRGIIIHHGFDKTARAYKAAINFVVMTYDHVNREYTYDHVDSTFYEVVGGHLKKTSLVHWRANEGKTYLQEVLVKHKVSSPPASLDAEDDTCYVIPWDGELEYLIAHNKSSITSSTKLALACTAEGAIDSRHGCTFRHHVAINLMNSSDLVDDHDYPGFLFRMKSADLGTPCPPRCRRFRFSDRSANCP